jgi:hypothetical protein
MLSALKSVRVRCMNEVSMEKSMQLLNHVGWNDHMNEMSMEKSV